MIALIFLGVLGVTAILVLQVAKAHVQVPRDFRVAIRRLQEALERDKDLPSQPDDWRREVRSLVRKYNREIG